MGGRGTAYSTDEYKNKLYLLVGDEYTLLSEYKNAHTPVKIRHNICGNIYEIQPRNFKSGNRCSKCRLKDRTTTTKEYKHYVSTITNGEYALVSKYVSSHKKVSIRHNLCKNVFNIEPRSFNAGIRCAYCFGNKITEKDIVDRINDKFGTDYTLISSYINSRTSLKVRHNVCGNVFKVMPTSLLLNKTYYCHKCYTHFHGKLIKRTDLVSKRNSYYLKVHIPKYGNGRYKYTYDYVKKYICNETDGEYILLSTVYKRAKDKILIKHLKCGNEYMVSFEKFLIGERCPKCNSSKGEAKVRKYLRNQNITFVEQYRLCQNPKTNHYLFSDFALLDKDNNVIGIIEYDGEQHFAKLRGMFAKRATLSDNKYRDNLKDNYCHAHGIPVCRIPYYKDIHLKHIIDNFLDNIL